MDILSPKWRVLLGSIGFFWSITYVTLCALSLMTMYAGALASVVGFSSGLITAGLLKKK